MKHDNKPKRDRTKFLQDLEQNLGETVLHTELGELRANDEIYSLLNLKKQKTRRTERMCIANFQPLPL